jgi:hypothetical protein
MVYSLITLHVHYHLQLTKTKYYLLGATAVSIVSDYELDNQEIGIRSLAEAKGFSSNLSVQTGSRAHPDSYEMGTGAVLSPGVKCDQVVTLTTHPPPPI